MAWMPLPEKGKGASQDPNTGNLPIFHDQADITHNGTTPDQNYLAMKLSQAAGTRGRTDPILLIYLLILPVAPCFSP